MKKLREQAELFNEEYFHGSINIDAITFNTSKRYTRRRGQFHTNKTITLAERLMAFDHEWKHTLLHELIHAWTWEMFSELSHTGYFKLKAQEIKLFSLGHYDIERCKVSSPELAEAMKGKARQSNSINYAVYSVKKKQWNFMRNLKAEDIEDLKSIGREVYFYDGNIKPWRCNKNLHAYLSTKYCYTEGRYGEEIRKEIRRI